MDEVSRWNDEWKKAQLANSASGSGREGWHAWRGEAEARSYWARQAGREDDKARELLELIGPDWRVLDIGSGPGTIALPLAAKAARVTAVEPAEGMALVLDENIAARGLRNVDVARKRWDDIEIGADIGEAYDLTVASYSMGMLDLAEAIDKMLAVTRRELVIYWHAGHQAWDVDALELMPLLRGTAFTPIPKADIVFNLLYAKGLYPDVRVIRPSFVARFASMEEAMEQYCSRFEARAPEQRALVRGYLEKALAPESGTLVHRHRNTGMRISLSFSR
jgi:SAM-dependent methyltransferase